MYPNPFDSTGFAGFWLRVEQEWAEHYKRYYVYDDDDPDSETCPNCGLVGSCMCDEMMQEDLDPEGLGLYDDYGGDYY